MDLSLGRHDEIRERKFAWIKEKHVFNNCVVIIYKNFSRLAGKFGDIKSVYVCVIKRSEKQRESYCSADYKDYKYGTQNYIFCYFNDDTSAFRMQSKTPQKQDISFYGVLCYFVRTYFSRTEIQVTW